MFTSCSRALESKAAHSKLRAVNVGHLCRTSIIAFVLAGCGGDPPRNHGRVPTGPTPTTPPVPVPTASASEATSAAATEPPPVAHVFPPPPLSPPEAGSKREGDGVWTPLPARGAQPSPFAMTVIHPHPTSPLIELGVAAVDLTRVSVNLAAGREEPTSTAVPLADRTGLVPPSELDRLLGMTNGGFKARHGSHGMKVGEAQYLPPLDGACTLAATRTGEMRIGTWSRLVADAGDFAWFRQGAPCLVEDGVVGPEALAPFNVRVWGASQEGQRDIRRSAYALSKEKDVLYFAIGNQVEPDFFGKALAAIGMQSACQFDINYSYVRFVVFERPDGGDFVASNPLMKDLKYTKGEGWKNPAPRDFFYFLTKN